MGVDRPDDSQPRPPSGHVRCVGCGAVYVMPTGRRTASANPGCPQCGYVGWVRHGPLLTQDAVRLRSVADRLPRRTG
jgi:hypothetical protein